MVKEVFPDKPYVNLERLHMRELANSDPEVFLNDYPKGADLRKAYEKYHVGLPEFICQAIQVLLIES